MVLRDRPDVPNIDDSVDGPLTWEFTVTHPDAPEDARPARLTLEVGPLPAHG